MYIYNLICTCNNPTNRWPTSFIREFCPLGKKGAAVAGSCTWHALKWRGRSGRLPAGSSSRRRRARGGCMAARSSASLHDPLMFLFNEGWKCWTADDASAARGTPALDSEMVWCWSDRYFNHISKLLKSYPGHLTPPYDTRDRSHQSSNPHLLGLHEQSALDQNPLQRVMQIRWYVSPKTGRAPR